MCAISLDVYRWDKGRDKSVPYKLRRIVFTYHT